MLLHTNSSASDFKECSVNQEREVKAFHLEAVRNITSSLSSLNNKEYKSVKRNGEILKNVFGRNDAAIKGEIRTNLEIVKFYIESASVKCSAAASSIHLNTPFFITQLEDTIAIDYSPDFFQISDPPHQGFIKRLFYYKFSAGQTKLTTKELDLSAKYQELVYLHSAFDDNLIAEFEIETRILDYDPVAGMKSVQKISIDFRKQTVISKFLTGSTSVIPSINDKFQVSNVEFIGDKVKFDVLGQTATGILIFPDIDYKFGLEVDQDMNFRVTGCHDAYPAYIFKANNKTVYQYAHPESGFFEVWKALYGRCDIIAFLNYKPSRQMKPTASK